MARDLNEAWGWIQRLVARVSRLESGAMLENSSITNGRMRFIGGLLRVDSGGRVEIVGTLNADGTINFKGPFALKGPATFEGDINQTGNYTVNSPGKITVAGSNAMTLGVGAFGLPGVGFASGGGVSGYTGGAFLHGGSNTVGCIANSTVATLSGGINNYVSASATKVSVSGPFETTGIVNLNNLPTTPASGKTPNLWIDSAGKLWKLV